MASSRRRFRAKVEKKVTFTDVYHVDTLVKIGEVKYDPFRTSHQYTALNDKGRIKDCETYRLAEMEVVCAHLTAEQDGKTV